MQTSLKLRRKFSSFLPLRHLFYSDDHPHYLNECSHFKKETCLTTKMWALIITDMSNNSGSQTFLNCGTHPVESSPTCNLLENGHQELFCGTQDFRGILVENHCAEQNCSVTGTWILLQKHFTKWSFILT